MEEYTRIPFEEPEVKPFMEQTTDVRGHIKVPVEITRLRPFLKRPFFELFLGETHLLTGLSPLQHQIFFILCEHVKIGNISYIKRKAISIMCDVLHDSITQAIRSLRDKKIVHQCGKQCPQDGIHHRQGVHILNPYLIWRFDKFTFDKQTMKWINIYRQACNEWDTYTKESL